MEPVLIGYFPKRRTPNPGWMIPEHVEEIASVSNCITKEPAEWIGYWRHNEMFVFDSPELAFSVVADDERAEFDIHAYAIYPVQFVKGHERAIELPVVEPVGLTKDFELLGYDVVSRSCETSFECSSLSCNAMRLDQPVNRYCLLDAPEAAFALAGIAETEGGEPGPYFVVKVWRRKRYTSPHSQSDLEVA